MNPAGARPCLNPLFRMQWEQAQQSWVLLYPEGMVKLNQSAAEILRRCDGERDMQGIVTDLEQAFSATGLAADVNAFLEIARAQRWVVWK
ncbi:MAG: pyrroloquinoline quinone biosynthesis peptide chaperone PqqD [Rhodocyclaceae bacterium]|nr:pyrroloquinoline quinone biosynthesis peptide chaperone PqqD [Rhodocyclaceae bacterium]MBX3669993.1 pyrroloquinoline quinone biosynthesis peptide chaperone PqqD [Rhodocyclaceae bacterium]